MAEDAPPPAKRAKREESEEEEDEEEEEEEEQVQQQGHQLQERQKQEEHEQQEQQADPPRVAGFAARPPPPVREPECRLLFYNVQKRANVGSIVRSAVAFGVREVVVAGGPKLQFFGNRGTKRWVRVVRFKKLESALAYLRGDGFSVVGVEIDERAADVATRPFRGRTAVMMGNEGHGLSEKSIAACDQLVYIRQVGLGTASLNVAAAAAIVLHHFCEWAAYDEAARDGQKFVVPNQAQQARQQEQQHAPGE